MHINPDHYLETQNGRIFTPEKNRLAWKQCFLDLQNELFSNNEVQIFYILIGCQGSGKTFWATHRSKSEPNNIIFDAILVKKLERKAILNLSKKFNKLCIAIYFKTTLDLFHNSKNDHLFGDYMYPATCEIDA